MTKLEDGWHKWVCFDHSHPHLYIDGICMNCGKKEELTTKGKD